MTKCEKEFEKRYDSCKSKLTALLAAIEDENKGQKNWGDVGSMGHLDDLLKEAAQFIGAD